MCATCSTTCIKETGKGERRLRARCWERLCARYARTVAGSARALGEDMRGGRAHNEDGALLECALYARLLGGTVMARRWRVAVDSKQRRREGVQALRAQHRGVHPIGWSQVRARVSARTLDAHLAFVDMS